MPRGKATEPAQREAFLAALAKGLTVTHAAASVGLYHSNLYAWRSLDPAFDAAWDAAVRQSIEQQRQEAVRRLTAQASRNGKPFVDAGAYDNRQLAKALLRMAVELERSTGRQRRGAAAGNEAADARPAHSAAASTGANRPAAATGTASVFPDEHPDDPLPPALAARVAAALKRVRP